MKNHLRVVWGAFALLVAVLIVVPVAMAAPVFKAQLQSGPVSLTLLDTQCSNPVVLKHLVGNVRPDLLDKFKDARLHWEGRDWASCWIERGGMVHSIDEEGMFLQPIPRDRFVDNSV